MWFATLSDRKHTNELFDVYDMFNSLTVASY